MGHSAKQRVSFPVGLGKSTDLLFDRDGMTSDAGLVLVGEADRRVGLTRELSACIKDPRNPRKATHDVLGLVRQRVFQLAAGYEDCNDADHLRGEPVLTRLKGAGRRKDCELASQPTLSRFENMVSSRELVRIGRTILDLVIQRAQARYGKKKVRRIMLDLDPTCDPTHGDQQLSLFHGFYDTHCYLPMCGFLTFDDHRENHLAAVLLRSGSSRDSEGAVSIMRRLIPKLRTAFPRSRILVRLDGGFCTPEILEFLDDEHRVDYVINLQKNSVLGDFPVVMEAMQRLVRAYETNEEIGEEYGDIEYAARAWDRGRRVVFKAKLAVTADREPKENPRFVVTNLRHVPRSVYKIYAGRGEIENRIKELKNGMAMGRTSCSRFFANQFRVLLTAASYILMQEIRLAAARTDCENAQIHTLRVRLLKIGAQVVESARRVALHGPKNYAWYSTFKTVARKLASGVT